jgi:surface protein
MEGMFNKCWSLEEVKGIENWDCSKVAKFGSMFQEATAFGGDLDLRNWKVGQNATVTSIYSFMNGCTNLKSVDMSGWILPDKINFANFMANQDSLHTVRVIGWSAVNIQNICGVIGSYVGGTIYGDVIIDETYLRNDWVYEFDDVLEIARYTSSAAGILPTFNAGFTGYTVSEINKNNTYTVSITTDSLDNLPTKISFDSKTGLLTVDKLNTSNVTTMSDMFRGCNKLTSLDLSNFNTAKVTNMSSMFYGCESLTSLDVSVFDTTNVTDMSYMFQNCHNLASLDVSVFDTTNVTDMGSIFNGCKKLTSLDLSNFNTAKVSDMSYMFYGCNKITSLDLSNFNTAKVTNMSHMFLDCSGLTSLNLSGFNTGRVTSMNQMFSGCSGLIELDSMQNIRKALKLSDTILDVTSLLDVIDNLSTVTTNTTLTLGSTLLAKLTEEQIAIATNKGWTVV